MADLSHAPLQNWNGEPPTETPAHILHRDDPFSFAAERALYAKPMTDAERDAFFAPRPNMPVLVAYRGFDYRSSITPGPCYYLDGDKWRDTLTDEPWSSQ